jgi:glycosyltransferase involved in cell wall biosynthesis
MRVAVFPQPRFLNPYQRLLHEALARRGVDVLGPTRWTARWALQRAGAVDVVHLHWIEQLLSASPHPVKGWVQAQLRAARLRTAVRHLRRRGTRVVWTVHNLRPHEPRHPRLEEGVTRALLGEVDALIVHSAHAAARLRQVYGGGLAPVHVVPHAGYVGVYPDCTAPRDELRRALGLPPRAFVVLAFGHVRPYKNIGPLVEAFRGVHAPDMHLVIAGLPRDPRMQEAVESASRGDERIHLMLRAIDDEEVAPLHRAADAAVFAYDDVFSSGALMLALSFGLPVLAPGPSTATELGGAAVVSFAPQRLRAALECLPDLDHDDLRVRARRVAEACTWDKMADATLHAYRRCST